MAFGTNVLPKKPRTPRPVAAPPGAADQAGDMMPVTPAVPGVGELVGQFQEQGEAARAATEARYARGLGIHEELAAGFGAGGTLQTAMMGQYQRQKERDLAIQKQHMIGSGLMGTTIAAGMPAAYEEQVGTPYKMQMADLMAQRQAEAQRGVAGFIERREDIPPSPELMAGLVERAAARPEDAVAGEVPTGEAPTTSAEIAAAGGVPSMAEVAGQRAFTPPVAPTTTGGPTMPGFAATGSGWGGGGAGGGLDFQIPDVTGGGGATVREPGRGIGPGVAAKDLTLPSDTTFGKPKQPGETGAQYLSRKAREAYIKSEQAGRGTAASLAGTPQAGADIGTALGTAAGAMFGPAGMAAGGVLGSLAGTYLGKR